MANPKNIAVKTTVITESLIDISLPKRVYSTKITKLISPTIKKTQANNQTDNDGISN